MLKLFICLFLVRALMAQPISDEMRVVDVNQTIENAIHLRKVFEKTKIAQEITKIITALYELTDDEVAMLKNPNRKKDNELVDLANKINNLIDMITEDPKDSSGLGALIMAGNDLRVYIQNHRKGGPIENEKSFS